MWGIMAVIIFILLAAFFISFAFNRREKTTVPYNRMQYTDGETVTKLICDVCARAKTADTGKGINPASLMPKIRRANALIGKKIKRGEIVTEAEKWLYENFYLLYRYVYMRKDDMENLPHIGGVPRIVVIAKIIVNNSLGRLDGGRVRGIFDGMKGVLLSYPELRQLNNAIYYALTEQAYILSERLLRHYKNKINAHKFAAKYLDSDVYVYYLYKNGNLTDKQRQYLCKRGLTEKKATVNYNNSVLYNSEAAKTVFTGMREAESYIPSDIALRYLGAYRIIGKDFELNNLSVGTLKDYFTVVSDVAAVTGAEEDYVAERACELAKFNSCDISIVLFDYKRQLKKSVLSGQTVKFKPKSTILKQRVYSWSIILTALISAACVSVFFDIAAGILSVIPFFFIAENLINYCLGFLVRSKNPPETDFKTVPYEHRVAVVVSEFVSSLEQFKESLKHIRLLRASNGGDNIEFLLLIDAKGDAPVSALDREIADYVTKQEVEDDICVLLRKKSLVNGKYIGKERKRGAINSLNKYLVTGDKSEFFFIGNENIFIPKYVVTLDADNSLITADVTEMVNIMAHPYNLRYDMMTLHSRYDLYSLKTKYSKRFMDECGIEEYPVYSDLFYRAFGRDVYCGKGIYRLNAFYSKLDGIFPSGKILSHDVIEGTVLKTGGATTVLEDAPVGFISDRERKKRWMRGDIQLIPFIGGRWKTDDGTKYKTDNEPIYKFIMSRNVLSAINATFLAALLLRGLFSPTVLIFSAAVFAAPYIVDIVKILRGMAYGERFRYLFSDIAKKILRLVEDFFLVGYYAVDNLVLIVKTLYAMAAKKNLLNWKTYHDSQSDAAVSEFIKEVTPSFAVLTAIGAAFFFFTPYGALAVGGYLLISLAVWFGLYADSYSKIKKADLSEAEKKKLLRYADKTFRYFTYMLSYGALIGDNLQIKPYKGTAQTTSPTNIGFSLLAQICGYELKFISLDECLKNMSEIIEEVDKLPKWRGNLYNWYDIGTKKPVNKFVSSVDSGNFLACLIVCREFFAKHGHEVNELKTELLIMNTDISALYDENRNMFYIGFDGEKFVGHYDILNSESRILTTVYTAFYKNIKNYRCLQRDYSSFGGNTLLSWSGTAFETLMPSLFISAPINSAIGRTEKNVCRAQIDNKVNGVWGIGESGFYAFDENLKYQYYAFGIRYLSLKNEYTQPVISPYSSALCLSYYPKETVKNLERLEANGVSGEYGFYEAVDLRYNKTVSSFMSHHQGMILCAIADFLCDGVIKKLFVSDEKIAAAVKNYNEMMPRSNIARYLAEKQPKQTIKEKVYSKTVTNLEEYFHTFALNNGDYSVFVNGFGAGFSKNGNINLGKFFGVYEENYGSFFYLKSDDGKIISPTFLPVADDCRYSVTDIGKEIIFENATSGVTEKITLLGGLNGEVRKFSRNDKAVGGEVAFFSSVSLNTADGYISHPTYNGLFISAKCKDNVLIIKNRRKQKNDKDYYIGVKVEGVDELKFECNTENFVGRNGSLRNPKIFSGEKTAPSLGDVLNPCIGFSGKFKGECSVAIVYSEDEEELVNTLASLPENLYDFALLSDSGSQIGTKTRDILGELLYVPYSKRQLNLIVKNGLTEIYRRKTSGAKLLLYKFSETNLRGLTEFISVLNDLKILGIRVKAYIEVKTDERSDAERFIETSLKANFVSDCEIVTDRENLSAFAFIVFNSDMSYRKTKFDFNKKFLLIRAEEEHYGKNTLSSGAALYRSGRGGFDENDCYITDGKPMLPYSNVIAAERGGMITTEAGGGFFYFENSRENKMNRFDNDPIIDDFTEFLYAKTAMGTHRLNSGSGQNRFAVFERGQTVFVTKMNGLTCTVKYDTVCNGRARVITVNSSLDVGYAEFIYGFFPTLDWRYDPSACAVTRYENFFTVTNLLKGEKLYIGVFSDKKRDLTFTEESRVPYFEYFVSDEEVKFYIVFSQDENLVKSFNYSNISIYEEKEEEYFSSLGNIDVASRYRSFNVLARWLPYQISSSRINGKLGFYQVGGANGFRDRLQDSLAVMNYMPEKTREIIIDSAKHQYYEGDVMHWWHTPKFGLRTKITDDKLFLPLVVAEYVAFTADYAILDMELPYLQSPPLAEWEKTRYEDPPYTTVRESLLKHCLKAIKSALRYGEHGLLIMGTGDWNDGMDEVCAEGKGESVFNSMLLHEVAQKIAPLCGETERRELLTIAEELKSAVNRYAYEKDRYTRLYSDGGAWLGSEGSETLKLDILTQSYAVISGVADKERAETVLKTAESLIDTEAGIIKLLSPPLKENSGIGYISAYPEGVRENGGQYTHAAIWYLFALTRIGRQDDAFELLNMINPVEKSRDEAREKMYRGEPYVLAGDVYSNAENYGRMGWSWYTGSAGWAYRLIVEEFYGLKRRGKKLYIEPHLPKKLSSSVLSYRYGESVYSIEYLTDEKFSVEVNGDILAENYITLEQGTLKKIKVTAPLGKIGEGKFT